MSVTWYKKTSLEGWQETHWDKADKELKTVEMVTSIVCLVLVRFVPSSKAFLYHVRDEHSAKGHWLTVVDVGYLSK